MSEHVYISDVHRLAWPYADSLSLFLGENPQALAAWCELGEEAHRTRSKLPKIEATEESVAAWNSASREIQADMISKRIVMLLRFGANEEAVTVYQTLLGTYIK